MAVSIACPSCKKPVSLASVAEGGRVTCPNPQCGHQFRAPGSSDGRPGGPSLGTAAMKGRPGAATSALAKLPPNLYASPVFVTGGAVVVLLYGLFLAAVVSSHRKHQREAPPVQDTLAIVHEQPITSRQPVAVAESKAVEAASGQRPEAAEPRKSAPAAADAPAEAPKVAEAPASQPNSPEPSKIPTAPAKTAVASLTKSVKDAPAPPTVGGIGVWVDPDNDCESSVDSDAVTISVPPTLHANSRELGKANAPRIVTEVNGDFVVQVRIAGKIQPGSEPLPDLPFAFQGAGILMWQDEANYVRFERVALSSPDRPLVQALLFESCRDGKPGNPYQVTVRDRPTTLRLERRGSDIACSYNSDGKTWIALKTASLSFAKKLGVGVSASNIAPKSFSARFENFSLSTGASKPVKSRK